MGDKVEFKPPVTKILNETLGVIVDPAVRRRLLERAILELKDRAAAYPEEGPWNKQPGTRGDNRWYQRQFGPRWKRRDGTLGGSNTSQKLQKSWQTEIQRQDEFSASAFTGVTYAPFLLDPEQQVNWAHGHGWENIDEIAEGYADRFEELVLEEVDK